MRAQCCICADLFENSLAVNIAASPCGHTFHEDCLMRWMNTSSTCPSCRTHIKKNQIIKRLFFDIREETDEDEDVDRLLNQIGTLQAQLNERDKQKQELAESRDLFSARCVASEAESVELRIKLHDEQTVRDVLQRDLHLLRKENAAFIEEMKEFRKTQRRVQELQNIDTILKGCDSDIQEVVTQYSDGGESSIKQLGSLLTVLKREYNQVLADKKALREKVVKLKRSLDHYHHEAKKSKQEVKELKLDLERTNETLSQVEKDNNENRRRLVHLRNAVRHNKTEGSQSFHRALNEDSPNVAFTPPQSLHPTKYDFDENGEELGSSPDKDICMTPDLFSDSPVVRRSYLKRKCLEELEGPKLKFANIPTAAERIQTSRQGKSETAEDHVPKLPQAMLSFMQKKFTGQSNSRSHVPSVITRGYNGFGGSTTFIHPQGQAKNVPLKLIPKKNVKGNKFMNPKLLAKQPQISNFVNSCCTSSSSSTSASLEETVENDKFTTGRQPSISRFKNEDVPKVTKKSSLMALRTSQTLLWEKPKLSADIADFIDLT